MAVGNAESRGGDLSSELNKAGQNGQMETTTVETPQTTPENCGNTPEIADAAEATSEPDAVPTGTIDEDILALGAALTDMLDSGARVDIHYTFLC
jgi:hypothetical protein